VLIVLGLAVAIGLGTAALIMLLDYMLTAGPSTGREVY
jgi:hypothetical protein